MNQQQPSSVEITACFEEAKKVFQFSSQDFDDFCVRLREEFTGDDGQGRLPEVVQIKYKDEDDDLVIL